MPSSDARPARTPNPPRSEISHHRLGLHESAEPEVLIMGDRCASQDSAVNIVFYLSCRTIYIDATYAKAFKAALAARRHKEASRHRKQPLRKRVLSMPLRKAL
jgi:hypothetical protein